MAGGGQRFAVIRTDAIDPDSSHWKLVNFCRPTFVEPSQPDRLKPSDFRNGFANSTL
jgi:hypothetical protein